MRDFSQSCSAPEARTSRPAEILLPVVYEELRKLAAAHLAREQAGHTLQPTALVHEAYLRLAAVNQEQIWENAGHFFAAAAEAMRRILIDSARRKRRLKHGGDRRRVGIDDVTLIDEDPRHDLLALDAALTRLSAEEPQVAKLVELRQFAGLSVDEAARVLGISPSTANRLWSFARAWLRREIAVEVERQVR